MSFNYRLLAFQHLLGTAVLTAMTLLLSIRFPQSGTERYFRVTLALLALSAAAVIPLFGSSPTRRLAFLPLVLFLVAVISFLLLVTKTTRELYRKIRERRPWL